VLVMVISVVAGAAMSLGRSLGLLGGAGLASGQQASVVEPPHGVPIRVYQRSQLNAKLLAGR